MLSANTLGSMLTPLSRSNWRAVCRFSCLNDVTQKEKLIRSGPDYRDPIISFVAIV